MPAKKTYDFLMDFIKDMKRMNYKDQYINKCKLAIGRVYDSYGSVRKEDLDRFLDQMEKEGATSHALTNQRSSHRTYIKWMNGELKEQHRKTYNGCDEDCFNCKYPDCYMPISKCLKDVYII